MPELPEVETVVRTLKPHIQGRAIKNVELLRQSAVHPESLPLISLIDKRIEDVNRRGKLILLSLSGENNEKELPDYLIFHLRMTGKLLPKYENVIKNPHTRCIFTLASPEGNISQLFFDDMRTFGKILAISKEKLEKWDFWQKLGPEPLQLDPIRFRQCLKTARPIKTALLDQQVIAGIGNIYADESLFRARIDPRRLAKDLSCEETTALLLAIQDILNKAIESKGSSIRDYVDANGKSGGFQKKFAVYGKGGKSCGCCGSELQKIHLGGRSTVFCPKCQI